MTRKRLHSIGIVLLMLGFVALLLHFAARLAQRRETDAFAARLDNLSIRIDDSFTLPKNERNTDALVVSIEDARAELTGIKRSRESAVSPTNLALMLYCGLTVVGSGFIIAGSRLPQGRTDATSG